MCPIGFSLKKGLHQVKPAIEETSPEWQAFLHSIYANEPSTYDTESSSFQLQINALSDAYSRRINFPTDDSKLHFVSFLANSLSQGTHPQIPNIKKNLELALFRLLTLEHEQQKQKLLYWFDKHTALGVTCDPGSFARVESLTNMLMSTVQGPLFGMLHAFYTSIVKEVANQLISLISRHGLLTTGQEIHYEVLVKAVLEAKEEKTHAVVEQILREKDVHALSIAHLIHQQGARIFKSPLIEDNSHIPPYMQYIEDEFAKRFIVEAMIESFYTQYEDKLQELEPLIQEYCMTLVEPAKSNPEYDRLYDEYDKNLKRLGEIHATLEQELLRFFHDYGHCLPGKEHDPFETTPLPDSDPDAGDQYSFNTKTFLESLRPILTDILEKEQWIIWQGPNSLEELSAVPRDHVFYLHRSDNLAKIKTLPFYAHTLAHPPQVFTPALVNFNSLLLSAIPTHFKDAAFSNFFTQNIPQWLLSAETLSPSEQVAVVVGLVNTIRVTAHPPSGIIEALTSEFFKVFKSHEKELTQLVSPETFEWAINHWSERNAYEQALNQRLLRGEDPRKEVSWKWYFNRFCQRLTNEEQADDLLALLTAISWKREETLKIGSILLVKRKNLSLLRALLQKSPHFFLSFQKAFSKTSALHLPAFAPDASICSNDTFLSALQTGLRAGELSAFDKAALFLCFNFQIYKTFRRREENQQITTIFNSFITAIFEDPEENFKKIWEGTSLSDGAKSSFVLLIRPFLFIPFNRPLGHEEDLSYPLLSFITRYIMQPGSPYYRLLLKYNMPSNPTPAFQNFLNDHQFYRLGLGSQGRNDGLDKEVAKQFSDFILWICTHHSADLTIRKDALNQVVLRVKNNDLFILENGFEELTWGFLEVPLRLEFIENLLTSLRAVPAQLCKLLHIIDSSLEREDSPWSFLKQQWLALQEEAVTFLLREHSEIFHENEPYLAQQRKQYEAQRYQEYCELPKEGPEALRKFTDLVKRLREHYLNSLLSKIFFEEAQADPPHLNRIYLLITHARWGKPSSYGEEDLLDRIAIKHPKHISPLIEALLHPSAPTFLSPKALIEIATFCKEHFYTPNPSSSNQKIDRCIKLKWYSDEELNVLSTRASFVSSQLPTFVISPPKAAPKISFLQKIWQKVQALWRRFCQWVSSSGEKPVNPKPAHSQQFPGNSQQSRVSTPTSEQEDNTRAISSARPPLPQQR